MGNLTETQAKKLVEKGVLDNETFNQMLADGLISEGRGATRRYVKTEDGTWVSPMLYFAGLSGAKYSKEMLKLKVEVNKVIKKHTKKERK